MAELTLVIGNKSYSSWSLRPWLLLKQAAIPFNEIYIPTHTPQTRAAILKHSPAGRVPVLHDENITVWESLAICEYLAEKFPEKDLWPKDLAARALARSLATEMHAGFGALRTHMTMNCRKRFPGKGRTPEVAADIARVQELWNDCRKRYGSGGDFLFGRFSVADAMYAPVATRFKTYEVELDKVSAAYRDTILNLPAMRQWYADASAEREVIDEFEQRV